jgi:hypothetical protein
MDEDIHRKLHEILNSVNPLQFVNIIASIVRSPGTIDYILIYAGTPRRSTAPTGISPTVYMACAAAAAGAVVLVALLVIKYNRS